MNPQTRNNLIALAVIGGIALVVGGGFGIWALNRYMKTAPFEKQMADYIAPVAQQGGPPAVPGKPVGKMITVERGSRDTIDWLYFELPKEIQPTKPEEVETVVWLYWSDKQIDTYDNGCKAMVHLCRVMVIDKASRQLVAERNFEGGEPPMTTKSTVSEYGSKPNTDIVNFLKSLPRK